VAMERTKLNDVLNGGYIEEYEFDMRRNRFSMRVDVLDNGVLSSHNLRFEKVSHFQFDTESLSEGGDRLQLTELWIDEPPEKSSSEEWGITISIFDMSHIRIRCSVISLNGDALH
jgi:hypothetical protein